MKICLFTPTFLPALGGAERAADRIVRGLIAKGHTVTVLCQKQGKFPDTPYPVRRYIRPPAQHLWPELLCHAIKKAHKAWKFDVMLAFYGYPTGYAASKLKNKLGYKLVTSPRGSDLYPNFHSLKKPRVQKTIISAYQNADRIVAISRWIKNRLYEVCGQNLPPIDMAHNGIDIQQHNKDLAFSRKNPTPKFTQEHDLQPKRFILQLARVNPVKQHYIAIDAVNQTKDIFRQKNLKYAIVGDGQSIPDLQKQIAKYNLQDIVKICGSKNGNDKFWLLDNALLMTTTSREEGMPNVVIEAMASNLPIVASNIDPHLELIENKNWGLIFQDKNPADMAQKLTQILNQDLTSYKTAAQKLTPQFSLENMINNFEKSCLTALNQK